MFKQWSKTIREQVKSYWVTYKTDQIIRLYEREKYEKIPTKLKTFKQYQNIKIRDYGLLFFYISEENKTAIDKLLLKTTYKEKIINDTDNPSKISPTTFAILNNLPDMTQHLQQLGANLFAPNEEGNTLLHIAAFYKNLDAVKFALENNSMIDALNLEGDSPLFYAVIKESPEIIQFLLSKGASDLIMNKEGLYPIHEAVITGNLQIIKLLEPSLQRVRNNQPGVDPIHLAARLESTEPLDYLLAKDPSFANLEDRENSQTPLHYAANSRAEECARLLLLKGSQPNARDKFGNTPLHFAVFNKDIELCRALEEHGCDARIKNKDGLSSIDICYGDKDQTMINYFKSLNKYAQVFNNLYE